MHIIFTHVSGVSPITILTATVLHPVMHVVVGILSRGPGHVLGSEWGSRGFLWAAACYFKMRSLSAGASLRLGQSGLKQALHVFICNITVVTYFTSSASSSKQGSGTGLEAGSLQSPLQQEAQTLPALVPRVYSSKPTHPRGAAGS